MEKSIQQLENQAYKLSESNWRRKNVWGSTAAAMAAKNSRDALIDKAWLNAAAFHLNNKAKDFNEYLSVKAFGKEFDVVLDYNSPFFGCTLKIASPFEIERLLNNPSEIFKILES